MEISKKKKMKKSLIAYAFMAPALIILIMFVFYPIIYGIPLAFTDYSVVGSTHFVGWTNFTRAIHDKQFLMAIRNSVLFVLIVPPIQILALLLAVLVNKKLPGIKIFRVLFYIPVVTSMVAVSIIWGWIFNSDGLINSFLMSHHLIKSSILFLSSPKLALPSLMFITLWQGLGYYMMIYLAGLQSLPKDVEEAAMVDGASKFKTLIKIKIPLLKPYVWLCTFISILSAVGVFDVVYVLTNGGPNDSTMVINLYSFQKAFVDFNFGYASAVGLIAAIIMTALSAFIFVYGKKGGMSYYN